MFKKIAIALVVLLVILCGVIATRPDTFRIERSATIAAPADIVFGYVNDFHQWGGWSPWEKLDPTMKKTYSGEQAGVGAAYGWTGNSDVGEGTMTIKESAPTSRIAMDMRFLKPMESTALTEFTFTPQGDSVVVNWVMSGPNNILSKAIGIVMSMDKMVGTQFEQGLAALKTLAEADAAKRRAAEPPKADSMVPPPPAAVRK